MVLVGFPLENSQLSLQSRARQKDACRSDGAGLQVFRFPPLVLVQSINYKIHSKKNKVSFSVTISFPCVIKAI